MFRYKCTIIRERSIFFQWLDSPFAGLGRLIIEPSRLHSDTPHSVGLLCTSDQPVAQTST
jgi:hypothetical protein